MSRDRLELIRRTAKISIAVRRRHGPVHPTSLLQAVDYYVQVNSVVDMFRPVYRPQYQALTLTFESGDIAYNKSLGLNRLFLDTEGYIW